MRSARIPPQAGPAKPNFYRIWNVTKQVWAIISMIADRAENLRDARGHLLLLLIDQFEEIFGQQIKYSSEVDTFVSLLVTQYARPHPSLFVAFTIRSDYLGRCASFPGLSDAINHCDAIFRDAAGLNGERKAIAEALFRRLAERDSEGRYRRSPASLEEVKEIASCSESELQQVLAPFEDASFVEIRKSLGADENLLDISHETLIRTWDKAQA